MKLVVYTRRYFFYSSTKFHSYNSWNELQISVFPTYHQLLLLSQTLLAEEYHSRLEDKAHGMQLQSLLDFTQKIGNVEPLDAAIVEQIAWERIGIGI